MVAIKSHQASAFLNKADRRICAILCFGTDPGLVSERAQLAAKAWASVEDPPGEIIRIDEMDLDEDSGRLVVELETMPMFGGRKIVRASAGRRMNGAMLKPVLEPGPLPSVLVVDAGNLKPTDAMRKLFEKTAHCAAIACYPDESRDLASVVSTVLGEHGLTISADVRDVLVARLGANRALSRGEIEKLSIYCRGRKRVEVEDIEAVVADAAELTVDRVVQAAASGNSAQAVREFSRYCASGQSPQAVVISVQRYFDRLHRVRCELDQGRQLSDALRLLRPPLHFKQKDAFSAQCRSWNLARLTQAISTISRCAKSTRRTGAMEQLLTERLLLSLAQMGRAGRMRS